MKRSALSGTNPGTFIAACLLVVMLGYAYVNALGMGWRAVLVIHAGALLFLGCALFSRDLRSFLVFTLVFCISLQFHYYIYYLPLKGIESQPFISGITVDVVDLVLLALYAHWFFRLSIRKSAAGLTWGRPVGTVFLLWITSCVVSSLLKSKELSYSLFEVIVLIKGFFLYLYLVNNTTTVKDLQVIIFALFASSVAHGLYAVAQYLSGLNYTLHGELVRGYRGGYEGFRAVGFFGSWDATAAMFSFALPLLLTFFLTVQGQAKRLAAFLGMLVVIAGLFCLKVRAGYVAVLISSVVLLVVSYTKRRVSVSRFQNVVIAALAVVIVLSPLLAIRFLGGTMGEERMPLIKTALAMIENNWLLGVGVNNYALNIQRYVFPGWSESWMYTVHNEYLLRLAETGLIGFFTYYLIIGVVTVRLWRATRSSDPWIYLVSLGLFAAMVGSILPRMVSYYHYLNLFLEFSVILAITQALGNLESRRLAEETTRALKAEPSGAEVHSNP